MLFQGKKAASFARKPDPEIWAVLAFSEDEGLAAVDAVDGIAGRYL